MLDYILSLQTEYSTVRGRMESHGTVRLALLSWHGLYVSRGLAFRFDDGMTYGEILDYGPDRNDRRERNHRGLSSRIRAFVCDPRLMAWMKAFQEDHVYIHPSIHTCTSTHMAVRNRSSNMMTTSWGWRSVELGFYNVILLPEARYPRLIQHAYSPPHSLLRPTLSGLWGSWKDDEWSSYSAHHDVCTDMYPDQRQTQQEIHTGYSHDRGWHGFKVMTAPRCHPVSHPIITVLTHQRNDDPRKSQRLNGTSRRRCSYV